MPTPPPGSWTWPPPAGPDPPWLDLTPPLAGPAPPCQLDLIPPRLDWGLTPPLWTDRQTRVKTLPSPILRMRAVKMGFKMSLPNWYRVQGRGAGSSSHLRSQRTLPSRHTAYADGNDVPSALKSNYSKHLHVGLPIGVTAGDTRLIGNVPEGLDKGKSITCLLSASAIVLYIYT